MSTAAEQPRLQTQLDKVEKTSKAKIKVLRCVRSFKTDRVLRETEIR